MDNAFYADRPWTWRDRLRFKLFPLKVCHLPDAPATHEDCIISKTIVGFGWLDRIRILFSGQMVVDAKIVTEFTVGDTKSASVAYPSWREAKGRASR